MFYISLRSGHTSVETYKIYQAIRLEFVHFLWPRRITAIKTSDKWAKEMNTQFLGRIGMASKHKIFNLSSQIIKDIQIKMWIYFLL